MTDPRQDLAGAVGEMQQRLDTLTASLLAAIPEMSLSVADIARMQGLTVSTLSKAPWRLPGFGAHPDANHFPARYWLSTYRAWMEIPEQQRREQWDLMTVRERRKVRAA